MRDHDDLPEMPKRCSAKSHGELCGCTKFRWYAGFKGSQIEPPEPSGWMCEYCENMEFQAEDFERAQA